jgi:predicted ArsR family transcriptional regulator
MYLRKWQSDDKMTNVMTKPTSRQRILAYLKLHNGVSAAELSRALRVTAANVRHHLSILVADGRVQVLGLRPGQVRGRPVQIFGLSEVALGDNLSGLTDLVLTVLLENVPAPGQEALLGTLAARLAAVQPGEATGPLTRRLALTIELLNRLGYAARWEAHAAAPRIIFEHCPYAAVIGSHPELCRMDGLLLSQHLGVDVEQTACLEKNARGTTFCQFALK